jgi:hypothetical protein
MGLGQKEKSVGVSGGADTWREISNRACPKRPKHQTPKNIYVIEGFHDGASISSIPIWGNLGRRSKTYMLLKDSRWGIDTYLGQHAFDIMFGYSVWIFGLDIRFEMVCVV